MMMIDDDDEDLYSVDVYMGFLACTRENVNAP